MATRKKTKTNKSKKASKKTSKKTSKKKTSKKNTTKKATKKQATKKKVTKKKATKKTAKKASKKVAKKKAKKTAKKTVKKAAKKATKTKASASKATKTAQKSSKTKSTKPKKQASVLSQSSLQVGDRVPAFVASATKGSVSLESLKGKKVVIYFYPKDHTPGCTIEGHDFSKALPEFTAHNTLVYGVSRDSLSSHESFIDKQCYTIDLISDPDETLCQLFGVMVEKSLYGRKYVGVDRSTFLIDESGVVTHVWRNVKVDGHVDEVLKAAKGEQ